ncbi:heavy-metal-associated domain-containing protein [Arcobacteraceae bacterium]|nr:heavy-metal-associated domain-containing protein [Arcobacteraceae bacterium]
MKQTYQVQNVKCGGCANTLKKALLEDFGEVEVNLEKEPREITLEVPEDKKNNLKYKLRSLGYPLVDDELSPLQNVGAKAKSFVSCAIGKMD